MITRIAAGFFAFTAVFAMVAGSATAEVLPDGEYVFKNGDSTLYAKLTKKKTDKENGIYEVHTRVGYLSAASSEDGAKVVADGKSADTLWQLHDNGNGWNFLHSENGANALSNSDGKGTLKLRRNNAGGKGNADQLWKLEKK